MSEQEAGAASSVADKERADSLILIVDDDPAVRDWLGAVLSLEGYRRGAAFYLPKPLEPTALVSVIEQVIE